MDISQYSKTSYIQRFFPITPLGVFAGLLYGAAEDAVRKSSEQPDDPDNHDDPNDPKNNNGCGCLVLLIIVLTVGGVAMMM